MSNDTKVGPDAGPPPEWTNRGQNVSSFDLWAVGGHSTGLC
jgi:hypothetical protein